VQNQPEKGIWANKDLRQMGQFCGAAPILLDADAESTQPGGPIGGQTNATLRNEHFNYMLQWYGGHKRTFLGNIILFI
jgi:surfeit locus 1 family protein